MKKLIKNLILATLLLFAGGFSGAWLYNRIFDNSTSSYASANTVPSALASYKTSPIEAGLDFTRAAEVTINSVVHVKSYYERSMNSPYGNANPLFDFFYGNPGQNLQQQMPESSGSGVIISEDGYIVTNNHVINNANKVEIILNDKRSYVANVIGTDASSDLALLKIEEKGLPYIMYGNSEEVRIGQWVLAVGNPFNLTSTVTAGIVSAKARDIKLINTKHHIESFIQTDAAVNPGNSGGALVNTNGELIGINSAIASNTGSYTGYSFAIPTSIVRKVVNDLLEFGEVQRGFIGVSIRNLDSRLAEEKGIKQIKGVFVDELTEGGSAAESGIKKGDVISKVGDIDVNSSPELQEQVSKYRPGDKINVTLLRDNKEKVVLVTLKNKKGNTEVVRKESNEIISVLGVEFEPLDSNELLKFGLQGGIKVKKLGNGKFRGSGIKEGFIVTKIDRKLVLSSDDLIESLQNKKGAVLIEGIYPNGMSAYYAFGL